MPKKYRKRPVVIEAIQWTGDNLKDICKAWPDFKLSYTLTEQNDLGIYTLEKLMWADISDYIIKGVRGEFYACKADIFKETYEEVTE